MDFYLQICIKDGKPCGNSWNCCSGWCNLKYRCETSDWYGVGPLPMVCRKNNNLIMFLMKKNNTNMQSVF